MKRFMRRALVVLALLFVLIQVVPYGRAHENPPVSKEPAWDSPQTRALVERVCFDCHSHKTVWPWYSHIAPFSWLIQHDVDEAREHLNFSQWDKPQKHADEAAEEYEEGEMPPWFFYPLHSEAKLDDAERAQLIAGLKATFGD